MIVATILLALIAVAVVAGAIWLYGRHRRLGQVETGAQATAARILEEARKEGEAIRKEAQTQARDVIVQAKADWETDAELNRVLDAMPAAPPVAPNFTAQVMQAVERETAVPARAEGWFARGRLWNWLPRAAAACLVAGVVLLGYHEHQIRAREAMARRVADLARAVSASPELLANYDHIRRLGDTPPRADTNLLALLK